MIVPRITHVSAGHVGTTIDLVKQSNTVPRPVACRRILHHYKAVEPNRAVSNSNAITTDGLGQARTSQSSG
jgi:hypothetical protein